MDTLGSVWTVADGFAIVEFSNTRSAFQMKERLMSQTGALKVGESIMLILTMKEYLAYLSYATWFKAYEETHFG